MHGDLKTPWFQEIGKVFKQNGATDTLNYEFWRRSFFVLSSNLVTQWLRAHDHGDEFLPTDISVQSTLRRINFSSIQRNWIVRYVGGRITEFRSYFMQKFALTDVNDLTTVRIYKKKEKKKHAPSDDVSLTCVDVRN